MRNLQVSIHPEIEQFLVEADLAGAVFRNFNHLLQFSCALPTVHLAPLMLPQNCKHLTAKTAAKRALAMLVALLYFMRRGDGLTERREGVN